MFLKLLCNLFTFTIYLYLYKKNIICNFSEISIIKSVLCLILTFILYVSINFQYLFIGLILILSSILVNADSKTLDNFVKLENTKYGEKIKNVIGNLNEYIINNPLFYYYDNVFNYISLKLIDFNFYTNNNNEFQDNMFNQMKDMIKDINNDIDNLENIKKNNINDIDNNFPFINLSDDVDTENEMNDLLNNNKMMIDMVNLMNKMNSDILQLNKVNKEEIKDVNKEEIKDVNKEEIKDVNKEEIKDVNNEYNPVIQLNGQDRFQPREGSYFNIIQTYNYPASTPSNGVNTEEIKEVNTEEIKDDNKEEIKDDNKEEIKDDKLEDYLS